MTATTVGTTSTAWPSHRVQKRSVTATGKAKTNTTTHARDISETAIASNNAPPLNSVAGLTPTSCPARITTMAAATTGQADETRSATRWIRNAAASINPSGSGRDVTTTKISAPRHKAPINDATKYPTGSA